MSINPSEYRIPMAKAPEGVNIDRNCLCGAVRNSIHINFNGFVIPNPICAACEYKNRCSSGCPANLPADNGKFLGIDKKTCKFFKKGCYDRVVAIAEKLNLKRLGA